MVNTRSMTRNLNQNRRNTEIQNANSKLLSVRQDYDNLKAQRLALDKISNLPSTITETILCLLPIKEAARTSILSREWRFKWTKIPKLEFYQYAFKKSTDENHLSLQDQPFGLRKIMPSRFKLFYAIYEVLLVHQDPILEFSLFMNADETCIEIDHIINHLSRKNTIEKFSLILDYSHRYRLPLSVFSLHKLRKLSLCDCDIYHQPTFNGFGSLKTLYLDSVRISTKALLHLLSGCPLLKSVTLLISDWTVPSNENHNIIELVKCLPMIEKLVTWTWVTEYFDVDGVVPQELPISLVHLKYFRIEQLCLFDHRAFPLLILLIRCSPNLEKIVLEIFSSATDPDLREASIDDEVTLNQDYSDTRLEHLNELEIDGFVDFKHHLELVKFILAKSPVLEKLYIQLDEGVTKDEELNILRILLSCPRASAEVMDSLWDVVSVANKSR